MNNSVGCTGVIIANARGLGLLPNRQGLEPIIDNPLDIDFLVHSYAISLAGDRYRIHHHLEPFFILPTPEKTTVFNQRNWSYQVGAGVDWMGVGVRSHAD